MEKDIANKIECDELVKKANTIESNKKILQKKIKYVDKKTLDASKFIVTQDFNILTKVNFDVKVAEASKNVSAKKQEEKALDLGIR